MNFISNIIDKIVVSLFGCDKQRMGYNCKHQMHGDVKECGEFVTWSR